MIHFDLDDRYQDENVVGHAIPRREGIFLSMVFHGLLLAAILYLPQIPFFRLSPEDLERRRAEIEQRLRDEQQRTFVFVQPLEDLLALQPPLRAPLSDQDRIAQAPDEAPESENPEPLVLGNSDERVEAELAERARGPEDASPPEPEPESQVARVLPPSDTGFRRPEEAPLPSITGSLGEALRNLQDYVQDETFDNPRGGNDQPGATIQCDTKGVGFGPWLRRFVAKVRRRSYGRW